MKCPLVGHCVHTRPRSERGEGRERGHKDGENREGEREELSLSAFPGWSDGIERNVLSSSRNNTDLFSITLNKLETKIGKYLD